MIKGQKPLDYLYNELGFQILISFFSEEDIDRALSDPLLPDVEEFRERFEKMRHSFNKIQSTKRKDWKQLLTDPT